MQQQPKLVLQQLEDGLSAFRRHWLVGIIQAPFHPYRGVQTVFSVSCLRSHCYPDSYRVVGRRLQNTYPHRTDARSYGYGTGLGDRVSCAVIFSYTLAIGYPNTYRRDRSAIGYANHLC
jgi:hypothetical protein